MATLSHKRTSALLPWSNFSKIPSKPHPGCKAGAEAPARSGAPGRPDRRRWRCPPAQLPPAAVLSPGPAHSRAPDGPAECAASRAGAAACSREVVGARAQQPRPSAHRPGEGARGAGAGGSGAGGDRSPASPAGRRRQRAQRPGHEAGDVHPHPLEARGCRCGAGEPSAEPDPARPGHGQDRDLRGRRPRGSLPPVLRRPRKYAPATLPRAEPGTPRDPRPAPLRSLPPFLPSGNLGSKSALTRYRGASLRRPLPGSASTGSARVLPSARAWGCRREAPLRSPALRALAPHGAGNLIAPPGGRGWGQVPSHLIGAGPSPRRIPHPRGRLHQGEGKGQNGAGWWSPLAPLSFCPRNVSSGVGALRTSRATTQV